MVSNKVVLNRFLIILLDIRYWMKMKKKINDNFFSFK